MIKTFLTLVAIFALQTGFCQDEEDRHIDSLQHELAVSNNDTMRLILLGQIADVYSEINPDSAFYYAEKVIPITRKLQFKLEEAAALRIMGYAQINLGNYPRSLQYLLSAIEMASDPSSEKKLVPASYPPMDEFMDRSRSARSQRLTQLSRTLPECRNSLWQLRATMKKHYTITKPHCRLQKNPKIEPGKHYI